MVESETSYVGEHFAQGIHALRSSVKQLVFYAKNCLQKRPKGLALSRRPRLKTGSVDFDAPGIETVYRAIYHRRSLSTL